MKLCTLMTTLFVLSVTTTVCLQASNVDRVPDRSSPADPEPDFQHTILVGKMSSRQRKHLKQEILNLLGLDHTPKPAPGTKSNAAPRYMMSLYRHLQEKSDDTRVSSSRLDSSAKNKAGIIGQLDTADMIMSFINHAAEKNYSAENWLLRHCFFDLSEVSNADSVTNAQLRLFRMHDERRTETTIVQVFRLKRQQQADSKMELEVDLKVPSTFHGWLDLNVTKAAAEWTKHPARNRGLILMFSDSQGHLVDPREAGFVTDGNADDKQPFMVAFFKTNPTSANRVRRSVDEPRRPVKRADFSDEPGWPYQTDKYNHKKCQRRTLYVSFRDLEWQDWIIAPEGYAAYFCDGDCSFPLHAHMNATNHAIVQTLAHLMSPNAVPKPCCAPTKLSAISVLYFDDNSNVILKKYRNMVVRACGCH